MAFDLLHFLKVTTGLNSPHGCQVSRWWLWTSQTLKQETKTDQFPPENTKPEILLVARSPWELGPEPMLTPLCPLTWMNPRMLRLVLADVIWSFQGGVLLKKSKQQDAAKVKKISSPWKIKKFFEHSNLLFLFSKRQHPSKKISVSLGFCFLTFQIGHWLIGLGEGPFLLW